MRSLICLVFFASVLTLGCAREYIPISAAVAKEIKSGVPLDDIKKQLGEPHTPTAAQLAHIANVVKNMPEPMKSNAEKDRSLAWGNDSTFLVVKVNEKNIAWVTAWRE